MPNWKKVILSGSNAVLAEITASGNLLGSGTATGSYGLFTGSFGGDGTNLDLSSNTSISTTPFPFAGDGIISGSLLISSSNVGGVSTASLTLEGSGSTIFSVQGSQGQLFSLTDDLLHDNLVVNDISGDTIFKVSGSGLVTIPVGDLSGSGAATASYGHFIGDGSQLTNLPPAFPFLGTARITGSLIVSGSGGATIESSGSTVFEVIGSEGDLFTITDNLTTGSLFAVKDINGFPLLDVVANSTTPDTVTVGQSNLIVDSGSLQVTGSVGISGSLQIQGIADVSASIAAAGTSPFTAVGISGSWQGQNFISASQVSENAFPFNGSAIITGSLLVSGSNVDFTNATAISGSTFSGSFEGNGSGLTGIDIFPLTASSAAIISRSIASGDTDSTALRLFGSGSISESGIFEVEGSAGPLFSVADGLDGVLMEVNNISGLPLFQVSSSNEVFVNRGNLTSGVTTATASFAMFSGSFQGNASQLTNISAGNISGNVGSADTASFALTASSFVAVGTTSGLVPFTSTNGELITETGFEYNTTTNQLTVRSLDVIHLTSSFITSSQIHTSGSNIFGDDTTDTQTLIGTTKMTGSAEVTGSLNVSGDIKGGRFLVSNIQFANYHPTTETIRLGWTGDNTLIYGETIKLDANVTASGAISSSGAISAGSLTIDSKPTIDTFTSTIEELTLNPTGDWAAIRLNRDSYPKPIIVEGSITSSYNVSSSAASTASFGHYLGDGSQLTNLPPAFPFLGTARITGSLIVSSSNSTASLSLQGSGSTVFEVIGSEGTLFTVDDDLDGTIFTANDRTGNPVLEASASGEVYIGKAPQSLYTTAVISSNNANVTQSIYGLDTSSYGGAFFEYTAHSGSNARAGNIMSVWNGSNISFTETTTTDIGNTENLIMKVHVSESQAQLAAFSTTAGYNIKTIIKSI